MKKIAALTILALFVASACARKADAPAPPAPAKVAPANAGTPSPSASTRVAKIVFVDQVEACECTKKRIADSWSALQEALAKAPGIQVERVHLDTEEAKADLYDGMRSLVVPPGIYFLDENEALVEMLQGEVTAGQIAAVMAQKAP